MVPEQPYILVVDDLIDAADSMAELLTMWGFGAAPRYCGRSALASARSRPPAAVLLDLVMPGMNGFAFVRAFRVLPGCRAVPVVAVSGSVLPVRARAAGIDHFVLKPAAPAQLRALLDTLTRPHRLGPHPDGWASEYAPAARDLCAAGAG